MLSMKRCQFKTDLSQKNTLTTNLNIVLDIANILSLIYDRHCLAQTPLKMHLPKQ